MIKITDSQLSLRVIFRISEADSTLKALFKRRFAPSLPNFCIADRK